MSVDGLNGSFVFKSKRSPQFFKVITNVFLAALSITLVSLFIGEKSMAIYPFLLTE